MHKFYTLFSVFVESVRRSYRLTKTGTVRIKVHLAACLIYKGSFWLQSKTEYNTDVTPATT